MKTTVSAYDFERAFADMGRKDQFSYEGLKALYEWFEQYEEDTGEEIELDVIGICCDFSEYDTALEAAKEYGFEPDQDPDALVYLSNELLELTMTLKEAQDCLHPGPCDKEVTDLLEQAHISSQFDAMDPDEIRRDLGELGTWDEEELKDDEENRARLLWVAAGQIAEEYDEEEQEEAAIDWLNENTSVIVFDGGVIIQGF